jgi:hypothetical protein
VAERAGSRIAQATGGAGERGSRFCRAQQKSARSCALLTRGKIGGTAMSSTRPVPPRYAGKSEERKRGVRGAPGSAANPARIAPGGRCRWRCSVAVAATGAGPDEAEGLAALVVEEVGVDRRVEARVVELDREVVAALLGALRPRGTYLDFLRCYAKNRLCGVKYYAEFLGQG